MISFNISTIYVYRERYFVDLLDASEKKPIEMNHPPPSPQHAEKGIRWTFP
jgi:hypothetical protein